MNEWEKLQSEFDRLANEMRRAWLGWPSAGTAVAEWRPAMNAYRLADRLVLCFDLAGMRKEDIHVRVEGRRLTITGTRPAPEPVCDCRQQMQTLALEIDAGSFERSLELPA
ncbi:MAG: Hsp20/alpha crystallin family protein, partial [Verrucomicrobiae bacterium]|nr:Hsp20/alpha crystallin family protein [Verrucomicrobiae bacterium]